MAKQAKKKKLTPKQVAFVNHYMMNGGNGTRAAKAAGYAGDDVTLASVAYDNLRKPQIRAELDARMRETAMSADEVIHRLSEQGRSDARDLIGLTPAQIKKHPLGALIKEFEYTNAGDGIDTIKIKFYSKSEALGILAKYHQLLIEKVEVDWTVEVKAAGLDPAEVEEDLAAEFERHIREGEKSASRVRLEEGEGED